jgi:hypothetical protein
MPSPAKKVGLRLTPLGDLKRTGKLLRGPIKSATLQLSSWVDEAMPEVLWAILIVAYLSREQALDCFRRVLNKVGEHKGVLANRLLEHSRLVELVCPPMVGCWRMPVSLCAKKQSVLSACSIAALCDADIFRGSPPACTTSQL